MLDDKERSAEHHNKSARDLPPLPMQQKFYVDPEQKPVDSSNQPPDTHSNTAKIIHSVWTKDRANYKRNWQFIQAAEQTPPSGETTESVIPSSNIMKWPRWEV